MTKIAPTQAKKDRSPEWRTIDAIDCALFWAIYIMLIVGLCGLAFWFGQVWLAPINLDGSIRMWGDLWIGVHAIGFVVLAISIMCGVRSAHDIFKEWRRRTARERASGRIYWIFFVMLGLGFNGLLDYFPLTTRDHQPIPLWVAVLLASLGGFGMWQALLLCRDAKN